MEQKPVHSIILDTSPILNNNPALSTLLNKCEKLLTIPSVVDEVRDASARSRLEVMILPFLDIRVPKPESIKFVSDFSRKTGDFAVLSKPDIQVLALAYEIECEQNGGDWRLRKTPGQKGLNGSPPGTTDIKHDTLSEPTPSGENPPATGEVAADEKSTHNAEKKLSSQPQASDVPTSVKMDDLSRDVKTLEVTDSTETATEANLEGLNVSTVKTERASASDPESSDSEGWITPSNLRKQQIRDQNASTVPIAEDQVMQVATITGDFAMQKGEFKIHLKKNMQWNHRGDRFSIPKPVPGAANGKVGQGKGGGKGGWGQELILAEDQKEYLRVTSWKKGKKETDLMDSDYLPGILTGERGKTGGRPKIGGGRNVNSKRRF